MQASNKLKDYLKQKLDSLQVKYVDSGNEWLLTQCLNPNHNDTKPSMFLHETGNGRCTSCGYTVHRSFFIKDDVTLEDLIISKTFNDVIALLDSKYVEESSTLTATLPPASGQPLETYRGLPAELLNKVGGYLCGVGKFANRLIFPFYSLDRELIGYTGRLLTSDSDAPKYLHSMGLKTNQRILYGKLIADLSLPTNNGLVLVEGHMDALALIAQGIPATPLLGFKQPTTSFTVDAIRLGFDSYVLAFDNDEAGHIHMYHKNKEEKDVSLRVVWNKELPTTLGYYSSYGVVKLLYNSKYKDHHEMYEAFQQLKQKE